MLCLERANECVLDKWFAWGELVEGGGGGVGRRKLCHIIIFSKNLPHVIVLALNIMKLLYIKDFVCLIKWSSFLMPFGTGKIAGLEFTMAVR